MLLLDSLIDWCRVNIHAERYEGHGVPEAGEQQM